MTTPRPSEADVEALTLAIDGLLLRKGWAATGDDIARAVLDSDWLDTAVTKARAEALREAAREVPFAPAQSARVHRWLMDRADRIARGGDA